MSALRVFSLVQKVLVMLVESLVRALMESAVLKWFRLISSNYKAVCFC